MHIHQSHFSNHLGTPLRILSGNRAALGSQQQSATAGGPRAINLPNLNLPPQNPLEFNSGLRSA